MRGRAPWASGSSHLRGQVPVQTQGPVKGGLGELHFPLPVLCLKETGQRVLPLGKGTTRFAIRQSGCGTSSHFQDPFG